MVPIETRAADDSATTEFVFGLGPAMLTINAMVDDVAPTDIPVLILGESGTGKDAYARLIHQLSRKALPQFSKLNCSGVSSSDLLKHLTELLGAVAGKASAGTLYLDNIQDLDLDCQRSLLSHLPDDKIGMDEDRFSLRLISSATRNLEADVEAGRFRRELYFRLNGASLRLPSFRERREDLALFMDHFLKKHSALLNKNFVTLSGKSMQILSDYRWPGNIRELENFARKIIVFGDVQMTLNDLQAARIVNQKPGDSVGASSLKVASRAASKLAERELIIQALERTRWNRKRAAHDLQISYKSLLHKIKQIGPLNGERQG
ncbi:MAG TPA: sigma 54-interacting transcriptional regulator [Candidatus Acidoferrum sp.]